MRTETVYILCCPFDKADLRLTTITKDLAGDIIEGFFTCMQCQRLYPIVRGIPIMSPDEYREKRLEQPLLVRWQQHFAGKRVENFRLIANSNETQRPKAIT